MGTNYYVRPTGACETRCSNWVHLGKSSIGWAFTFRAYPNPDWQGPDAVTWPVTDFASWRRLLDLGLIYDEYGQPQLLEDFLKFIETKRGELNTLHGDDFLDDAGNRFCSAEFS
ncbi:MAG TPA: hypothetical protein VGS62_06865 [Streptosporangiaceae bacterium]|nr:hypothetical protein [Streptosporangiaceae bacterium]